MKKNYKIRSKLVIISSFLTANSIFALSTYASDANDEFTNLNSISFMYSPTASFASNEDVEPTPPTVHTLKRKLPEISLTSQQPEKKQKRFNSLDDNPDYYNADNALDISTQPNYVNHQEVYPFHLYNSSVQPTPQIVLRDQQNLITEQNKVQAKAKYDLATQYLRELKTELFMKSMKESAEMGYKDAVDYARIYKKDNPNDTFFNNISQVLPDKILTNSQNPGVQDEKNLNIYDVKNMDIASLEEQAAQDNDEARFELVLRYSQGKDVEKNLDLMNQYLFKINTDQHMASNLFMGISNLKGLNGFEEDLEEAKKYLNIAKNLGSIEAQNFLNDPMLLEEKNYASSTHYMSQKSPSMEDKLIEITPISFAQVISQPLFVMAQESQSVENQVSVSPPINLKEKTVDSLKKLLKTCGFRTELEQDVLFELAYRYGEGIGRIKQNTKTFYVYFNKIILEDHKLAREYKEECRLNGKHGM